MRATKTDIVDWLIVAILALALLMSCIANRLMVKPPYNDPYIEQTE